MSNYQINYPKRLNHLSLLILSYSTIVHAEVYQYNTWLPSSNSLEFLRSFSIAGTVDSPGDVEIHDDVQILKDSYSKINGVSLLLIDSDHLPRIDKTHFCCNHEYGCSDPHALRNSISNVEDWSKIMKSAAISDLSYDSNLNTENQESRFIYGVDIQNFQKSHHIPIYKTGMYYIGIANCGLKNYNKEKVSGRIFVKSSHGYLPAVDISAMTFNNLLLGIYSVIGAYWFFRCFRWKGQMVNLHCALSVVLIATWIATAARSSVYYLSNISELEFWPAEAVAETLHMVKFGLSLCTGVSVSLGWGTVHDVLGSSNLWSMLALGIAYIFSACMRILILWNFDVSDSESASTIPYDSNTTSMSSDSANTLSIGNSLSSSLFTHFGGTLFGRFGGTSTLILLPEGICFSMLIVWAKAGSVELNQSLEKLGQSENLKSLAQFIVLIKAAFVGCSILFVGQFFNEFLFDISDRWSKIWFFDEGGPNSLFMMVLGGSLLIFLPQDNYKIKCTSQQILTNDDHELHEIVGQEGSDIYNNQNPTTNSDGVPSPSTPTALNYLE